MKKGVVLAVTLSTFSWVVATAQAPHTEIKSAKMKATVYLPNAKTGLYRGVRFDWSGVIGDLEFAGHHLYRPWFTSVEPGIADFEFRGDSIVAGPNSAMTGPVEEFQKPLGYDTAKPGDTFVKVGVGLLRKVDDKPYSFRLPLELVDPGTWTTHQTANSITFEQTFRNPGSPYAYVYTKTLRLVGDTNQLIIEHRLKNIGTLPIQTVVYDHNFLTIDGQPVGSNYSISVPYDIKPTRSTDPKFVRIDGGKADYIADIQGEDRVSFGLQGFSDSAKDYDIRVTNSREKIEVHIVGDHPLTNAIVWSIRDVIAVEPTIAVAAEPGKEFTWTYTYTYTDLSQLH